MELTLLPYNTFDMCIETLSRFGGCLETERRQFDAYIKAEVELQRK
jgi:hypothetical protein